LAIAEVGSGSQRATATGASGDRTLAFPGDVTAGNLLIVAGCGFTVGGADPAPTITDTRTTSYTVASAAIFTNGRLFIGYGVAPSSGANTVSIDWASNTGNTFSIDEFSGQDSSPLDVDGGSSTGTGTAVSDSLSTLTAGALIIGVMAHDGTSGISITPGVNYTQIGEDQDNSFQDHNAVFRIATTATSYTVDWTIGASSPWGAYTLAFKPSAAAPSGFGPLIGGFSRFYLVRA
jgi:hypothetical protein